MSERVDQRNAWESVLARKYKI